MERAYFRKDDESKASIDKETSKLQDITASGRLKQWRFVLQAVLIVQARLYAFEVRVGGHGPGNK